MAFFSKNKIHEKAAESQEKTRKHTILIVDDEATNQEVLIGLLEKDYNLLVANSGKEALDLIKNDNNPTRIHLIVTDQRMPDMTGVQFLQQTIPIIPKTIRVILTGFTDVDAIIDSINKGQIYKFLTKPIDPTDLKVTIQRALETYDLEWYNYKLLNVFEKFVPTQFLKRIAPKGLQYLQFGKAQTEPLSILFADIRSFTTLSEAMTPQALLDFLNGYTKQISVPIHQNHGFIDKFIGDGIMVLFDRTEGSPDTHALDSVKAAIGMQQAINQYNQNQRKGLSPIEIGVGVHCGETIIGTMGSKDRMDSTALGDCVNLAAQLENLTKTYKSKILISEAIYQRLPPNHVHTREIDTIQIQGKEKSVTIYEVYEADSPEIFEKKQANQAIFAKGIEYYRASDFQKAYDCFQQCLQIFPQDIAVLEFLKQNYLRKLQKTPF